jgi:hypothetical protein
MGLRVSMHLGLISGKEREYIDTKAHDIFKHTTYIASLALPNTHFVLSVIFKVPNQR